MLENNIDPHIIIFTDESGFISVPILTCKSCGNVVSNTHTSMMTLSSSHHPVAGASVNSKSYLALIVENMWPDIKQFPLAAELLSKGWNKYLNFLSKKVPAKSDRPLPGHSSDLSKFDYWSWDEIDDVIAREKLKTLNALTRLVNEKVATMEKARVRQAVAAYAKECL